MLGLCAPLLSGCAYFNSMYNANRYTREAQRAERAGRRGEAAERWRLVVSHSDSLLARHPRSRWADDALLARGRALVSLGINSDAVTTLIRAAEAAPHAEQRHEAQLLLGRAQLAVHRPAEALTALDSALATHDGRRRSQAHLERGRALLALGRPDEALHDLRDSREEGARVERVRAALALRNGPLAVAYADSLVPRPFLESVWSPLLDSLAAAGLMDDASRLVDAIQEHPEAGRGARARLLVADGDRALRTGREPLAVQRFRTAQRLVPDSAEARDAAVRLLELSIRELMSDDELPRLRQQLLEIAAGGGEAGRRAAARLGAIGLADSLAVMSAAADACWFLRGEVLRDSLGAPQLAARAFGAMPERFPESPWTPKALLAAIALGHPEAERLRGELSGRYAASPYAAAAEGRTVEEERFAALEDSLRAVTTAAMSQRPGAVGAAPEAPVERRAFVPTSSQPIGLPGARAVTTPQRPATPGRGRTTAEP